MQQRKPKKIKIKSNKLYFGKADWALSLNLMKGAAHFKNGVGKGKIQSVRVMPKSLWYGGTAAGAGLNQSAGE